MATIDLIYTNHTFEKSNLVTKFDKKSNRGYDEQKCKLCGLTGKSFHPSTVEVSDRLNKETLIFCPMVLEEEPKTIKILAKPLFNNNDLDLSNLEIGSIHNVIPIPEEFKNDIIKYQNWSRSVWILSKNGLAFRLINNQNRIEFELV